jgi:hypothetical protein
LQEGRDLEAAEAALREVLRLEPGNAEARNNLGLLLRHKGAGSGAAQPGSAPQPDAVLSPYRGNREAEG